MAVIRPYFFEVAVVKVTSIVLSELVGLFLAGLFLAGLCVAWREPFLADRPSLMVRHRAAGTPLTLFAMGQLEIDSVNHLATSSWISS